MKQLGILACLVGAYIAGCSSPDNTRGEREIIWKVDTNLFEEAHIQGARALLGNVSVREIVWNGATFSNAVDSLMKQQFKTNTIEKSHLLMGISYFVRDPLLPITFSNEDITYRKLLDELCRQSDTYWTICGAFPLPDIDRQGVVTQVMVIISFKEWLNEAEKNHKY